MQQLGHVLGMIMQRCAWRRRVSQRGSIMVATQRIHVGMIHARKIVTVTATDHTFQLDIDGQTVATVPGTATGRSTVIRLTPSSSHAVRADGRTGLLCTS
jgi:hypothetical protein